MVTVLEPGRRVRVSVDEPGPKLVLQYAEALILKWGLNESWKTGDGKESSEETGYTLHDAIGAAGTKTLGDKDARGWRESATRLLSRFLGDQEDKQFENTHTKEEVLAVLRQAIEEAA